ncbi:hypothetical protein Pla144_10920 [Bythopirellula polymerisocia]|uniref:Uncharacterized protein n=1 Tax=Bythopirellula polymerisocia TaxID=2528003 RepID=A0A5C6D523_9BACT|nr:hypothetical protein Pla144_10920 [Bythopirellula polymerisocia]
MKFEGDKHQLRPTAVNDIDLTKWRVPRLCAEKNFYAGSKILRC